MSKVDGKNPKKGIQRLSTAFFAEYLQWIFFMTKRCCVPLPFRVVPRNFTALETEMKEFDFILAKYSTIFN